jgi:hypothetical protein
LAEDHVLGPSAVSLIEQPMVTDRTLKSRIALRVKLQSQFIGNRLKLLGTSFLIFVNAKYDQTHDDDNATNDKNNFHFESVSIFAAARSKEYFSEKSKTAQTSVHLSAEFEF